MRDELWLLLETDRKPCEDLREFDGDWEHDHSNIGCIQCTVGLGHEVGDLVVRVEKIRGIHVSDVAEILGHESTEAAPLIASAGLDGGQERVCLLDPRGESDIAPEDGDKFDVFVFGGILGDDPPRDRTAELRVKGFAGRRLGKEQLTTDTAARVTRIVVQDKSESIDEYLRSTNYCNSISDAIVIVPLAEVPYVDRPSIQVSAAESVEMPFKYVKGKDGKAIMPEVR